MNSPLANASPPSPKPKKNFVVRAILCVLCMLVGAFYPTMVDWAKTVLQRSLVVSASGALVTQEVRSYPFSPISVVLVDDAVQASIGLCFVAKKMGGVHAMWSDWGLILKMAPLGAIYALGELLTLRSVQKGSGPVYVVIANMKLVVAAVMSRAFFGSSVSMPWRNWAELVFISVAAAGYTLSEAGALGAEWCWEGAWTALIKSGLVAFTSVFCEHTYKSNPFYLTLTLQAVWGLLTALLLIGLSFSGVAASSVALELRDNEGTPSIFASGPAYPLCSSSDHLECIRWAESLLALPEVGQTLCQCITRRGWDFYTLCTVLANLSNAISSALIFRQLSAVAKYVCRASSAVPMYVFYCAMGRSSWSLRTFSVIMSLSLLVWRYTVERQQADAAKDTTEAARANASDAEAPQGNGWASHYAGYTANGVAGGSGSTALPANAPLRRRPQN